MTDFREKTFRIDRMEDTVINKKNIGDIPFDRDECIQRYRSSVFSMYSGHRITAEFEFDFLDFLVQRSAVGK